MNFGEIDNEKLSKNFEYIVAILAICICLVAGWLYHDAHRNDGVYTDTDNTVDRIEERISGIEQRLDTMQKRIAESKETVSAVSGRVEHSTNLAKEVTAGIGTAEQRLDEAMQRSGRIANIIADIEAEHQKRTANTQASNMAK